MESVELLNLNLAIEPDLQNFVCFLMESVRQLEGNTFRAALACLELTPLLRSAGASCGQPFQVAARLVNQNLHVHWGNCGFIIAQTNVSERTRIERLCEYLRKSTESIDPEILMLRNEAMARDLLQARVRAERELAELEIKLKSHQAELQISMHQAETDALTGLLNRRAFDIRLEQAFRHTMRQKNSPLSLIMLDLDHFKHVNDQHGHQYGDRYLIRMAQILRSVIREDVDCAFRFGGDEFAVMIHSDHLAAFDKAKQVLQQMDSKVSIGISTIDRNTYEECTLPDFIHQADSALYEAKRRGRGQIVVSQCSRGDQQACMFPCDLKDACV